MITVKRGDKLFGHFPEVLPTHFVCAECDGTLRIGMNASLESTVSCAAHPEHDGLKRVLDISNIKALETARSNARALQQLEKHLPYLKTFRKQKVKSLFGE